MISPGQLRGSREPRIEDLLNKLSSIGITAPIFLVVQKERNSNTKISRYLSDFQFNDDRRMQRELSDNVMEPAEITQWDVSYSDDQTAWYMDTKFYLLAIDDRIKHERLYVRDMFALFY